MKKPEMQNPAVHSCKYCSTKQQSLDANPHLQFRPPSLRQKTLLTIGYMTFGLKDEESAVASLPLPAHLIEEIKIIHDEIKRWDEDTSSLYKMVGKRYSFRHRDIENDYEKTLEWTAYRCFIPDLHWMPDKSMIDRRATANMIVQCNVGFDRRNEFLLAAANCLETEIVRLWTLLDSETRERWPSTYYCPYTQNPIFMYWIGKITNHHMRMNRALKEITHYCLAGGEHDFVTLKFFWPLIVESMGGVDNDRMKYLFDHAFHESIQNGNRLATFFVWNQAPAENYRSMVSAARCCGARNYYFAFQKAVERGQHDVVQLMWNHTDTEQHNRILLAEHAKAFCKAAEKGYTEIAKLLWHNATYNQKFILLFEQSCAAFRLGCGNGQMGIVRLLWEDATMDQRRQMLTVTECEALTSACKNGHVNVVRYLWENMGDELKLLMDTLMENSMILSKCIYESASLVNPTIGPSRPGVDNGEAALRYFFSDNFDRAKSQLVHALLFSDALALKALLKRGETTGKWDELVDLLKRFNLQERAQLCARMSIDQATFVGFSPPIDMDVIPIAAVAPVVQSDKASTSKGAVSE